MSVSSADSRRVASRYAVALFELASQKKKIDAVQSDLDGFVQALDESAELRRVVESPVMARADQAKGVDGVLAAAKAQELSRDFFRTLVENRRLDVVRAIAVKYAELVAQSRNEAVADVISAQELTAKQVKDLQVALQKSTGHDSVTIRSQVDPSIMGGVVVRIGGKMFDNSIASKLTRLAGSMKNQIAS